MPIPDATLYDLRTKSGRLEELPSGRLALDDEPISWGDVLMVDGKRVFVMHDGYEWFGRVTNGTMDEVALMDGVRAEWVLRA